MLKIDNALDFTGKVVIVTGGSTGIGEGCVRVFCAAGATVVFCARHEERGETLAVQLNTKGPGVCYFERCDVSNPDEVHVLIDKTAKQYKRLDCLVNNVGYHPPHRPIDEFSIKEFSEVLQTNLVSMFAASKYALPYLRKAEGSIINIGSLVGNIGQEWATTYCASKGGIVAFTKALAIDEARHGVRVNVILPGSILTENRRQFVAQANNPVELDRTIDQWQWMGRSGTMEEVGQVCLFLASEFASYITGVEVIISGGSELGYGKKCPPKFTVSKEAPDKGVV